ncbi:hypothetical protein [Chryseobacterium sp. CFBP8996]|jgi:hypothetical protein|uniref:hypothetical protein n=1 Tax=Chryseobacterium sp. CFBP8996 TaxID=3096529 RepID=UPI002A6AF25B|nr:hypothetical protein [Chryseobacterium sp. CFBP8996]MDY0930757.1 hypothetical protein [Chryseobacterium sp. CFBP8996]
MPDIFISPQHNLELNNATNQYAMTIYTPAECSSDILKPDKQPLPVLWQTLPLF